MLDLTICTKHSHLLQSGKTYNGAQFAAIIKTETKQTFKDLQNSPLFFQRTDNGIFVDSIYF